MSTIVIEDAVHAEHEGNFVSFEEAVAELRRRAAIPWEQPPNRPPCASWRKCRREFHVLEYEYGHASWNLLRQVIVVKLWAEGAEWAGDFEKAWAAAAHG